VVEMFDLLAEAAKSGDEGSLRRSFDRLRETTSEATKLFQGVVYEREAAQQLLTHLRRDHSVSEARVAELGAAFSAEVAKSAAVFGELAAMRDRLMEREATIAARSAELTAARGQLAVMQDRARRSEEDVKAVSKERDAIIQSMVWRMTKPVRSASARFPRLARHVRQCLNLVWWDGTLLRGALRRARDRVATSGEPNAELSALRARHDKAAIATSGLFDESWYKENYPDVAAAGIDPIEHYLSSGADEGRNPGPLFDTLEYLLRIPDAGAEGQNPLLHFIRTRARAGATDPVAAAGEVKVLTLADSTVGRLMGSFCKRSNEEEVAVIGVAVSQWRRHFPKI
jgi:hypothetical protein